MSPQNSIILTPQRKSLAEVAHDRQTSIQQGSLAESPTAPTHAVGTPRAATSYLSSSIHSLAARYGSQANSKSTASYGNQSIDQPTVGCEEVDYISEPPQYMVTVRSLSTAQYVQAWDSSWEQMEDHDSSSSSSENYNYDINSGKSNDSSSRSSNFRGSNSESGDSESGDSERNRHPDHSTGGNASPIRS